VQEILTSYGTAAADILVQSLHFNTRNSPQMMTLTTQSHYAKGSRSLEMASSSFSKVFSTRYAWLKLKRKLKALCMCYQHPKHSRLHLAKQRYQTCTQRINSSCLRQTETLRQPIFPLMFVCASLIARTQACSSQLSWVKEVQLHLVPQSSL
jgi:hypothetical protein